MLEKEHFEHVSQVEALTAEDLDRLFNIDQIIAARLSRKKPPLKVLWARYLRADAPAGVRHYGYERFCQLVAEHVRVNDLTAPIQHVPGHTMQADWAGTRMQLTDPITKVSVFIATLPYSRADVRAWLP